MNAETHNKVIIQHIYKNMDVQFSRA